VRFVRAQEVPAHRSGVVHENRSEGAADDVRLDAAPYHLDLRQLGHRSAGGLGVAPAQHRPGLRGSLLLGLLLAATLAATEAFALDPDLGGEGLGVVRAFLGSGRTRGLPHRSWRSAPAGSSSSPAPRPRAAESRSSGLIRRRTSELATSMPLSM
jgi:hypothetical protein